MLQLKCSYLSPKCNYSNDYSFLQKNNFNFCFFYIKVKFARTAYLFIIIL